MKSLELLRGDKWISYNSTVAKEIGIVETIFLMNLVTKYYYFEDAGALIEYDNDYYFYYTVETIENDTAITYKQLQRIIPNLTDLGFIKTIRKGLPAKIYYSINEEKINEYFFSRTQINQKQDMTKGKNLTIPKVITDNNQKSELDNTKSNNIIYNIKDKNDNKIKDNILCSNVSKETLEPVKFELPTNKFNSNKETFKVAESYYNDMKECYPNCDIDIELKKMKAWLLSNEINRKTIKGMKKFINNWLNKSQNNNKVNNAKSNANTSGQNGNVQSNDLRLYGGIANGDYPPEAYGGGW